MQKHYAFELDMLAYFWDEKGDLERYTGWDELQTELQAKYPEIVKAWQDYKTSRRTLTAVLHHARDSYPSSAGEARE